MTAEEWRPVQCYEGFYEVSSAGRVRSLDRTVVNARGVSQVRRGRILSPGTNGEGYRAVVLHRDGIPATRAIHRLVATAFLGPRPEGCQVRHLNGVAGDNSASNLQYGTASENMLDKVRHGTHHYANRTHCPQGHPYSPENTRVIGTPSGTGRQCRTCGAEATRRYRAKQRAAVA